MNIAVSLLVAGAVVLPFTGIHDGGAGSRQSTPIQYKVEIQTVLLSLELPAIETDHAKVGAVMDEFARRHAFKPEGDIRSPLWNIQRSYIGKHQTAVLLDLFPQHTFVVLFKRPRDIRTYDDLIRDLETTFGALGFKPWVELPG